MPEKTKTITISLQLEIAVESPEKESYLLAEAQPDNNAPVLCIGFLADLFDLFNFDASLGVERINGFTHEQIKKTLTAQA